ncbi:hypothetical protein [Longimicrobium sp.]|uniref:hypothetical protein n=1 Tax=Longimicrobium sp. TaxID=2029185 RepID=UPI003B3AA42C
MKNLFDPAAAAEIKARLPNLRPESERRWGTMNAAQAVAHCVAGLEMALGDTRPRRALAGRIFGPIVKRLALGNNAPFRRNTPTVPEMVVADARELDAERERLSGLIDRFARRAAPLTRTASSARSPRSSGPSSYTSTRIII